MVLVQQLTDQELLEELRELNKEGEEPGPITDTVCATYQRQVARHMAEKAKASSKAVNYRGDYRPVKVNVDTYLHQVQQLTDEELLKELREQGEEPGPITDTVRAVYQRQVARHMAEKAKASSKAVNYRGDYRPVKANVDTYLHVSGAAANR